MEYILIAKVEQVYGKAGYVKLQSFSDFPERFLYLKKIYIDFWGDKKTFYVEDVKNLSGKIIIKFKKFEGPKETQILVGKEIYVDENDKVDLPENHFFVHDLIGSEVIIENKRIGFVTDIIKGKANDVLVILTDDKNEKLIPFVLNFIEKFDTAKRQLILNISKEFLEDDEG